MRVLHIGKYFAPFKGGVETYLLDVLRALTDRGFDCLALVHRHERSLRGSEEDRRAPGGSFRVVRCATWFRAFFTPLSPGFPWTLRRIVRRFRPQVIHLHLPNPSACWLLATMRARRVPWVVHWHSDVVTERQGWFMRVLYRAYRPLERALLRRAAAIVATSQSYLDSSHSLRDFPAKCRVIPLGLDPARFEATTEPVDDSRSGPLQVLAVGRLTYYKGFGYLLRATAQVDNVDVHIVGEGELERELRAMAKQLEIDDRVTFHGAVDDRRLARLLQVCDCACLPSIERTEAFGLVLLEAMYFQRAAVSSRVHGSGMAWVVEDGVTGLQVPPADTEALAAALERLRDDRSLARALGMNGRNRFERHFTIDRSAESLAVLYRELVAPGTGA